MPSSLTPAVQSLFAAAEQHRQAGRLDDAERLFREVLVIDPRHAESLHLRGVTAHQTGRQELAVDLIRQAIAVDPGQAVYHSNLGNLLLHQGRVNEAVACYRTAITLNPSHAGAHNNLGNALREQGRADQAVACYRRTIELNPNFPEAHNNLGVTLLEQGRLEDAIACYRRAIDLKPDYADAYSNLGNALKEDGKLDDAAASLRTALELKPDHPDAHNNLGTVLLEQEQPDEAISCFRRALDLRPNYPQAHNNLGNTLREQGLLHDAVACYRRAVELKPDYPDAYSNLGIALHEQGLVDDAIACCRRAIELRPDYPEAYDNLGSALRKQQRLDEAIAAHRRAVEIKPEFPDAHANLAMALLARGDLAAGWEEYEWRWKTRHMIQGARDFAQPQWRGEPAEGRTLLIHAEQGFGDTLQFCRYASLAAERGLRVILEAPKPLVRVLRSLSGVDQVVALGEPLPEFDLHCPTMSMPLALGTTLATIPNAVPYLHADPAQMAALRTRLDAMAKPGPRIGLVWAGNSHKHLPLLAALDRRRSIAPDRLAPLVEHPGLHFVSLQRDGPAAPERFALTDLMHEMADFADTAALIANLDLVISVDTAVAHLAAALGKPVWMLDRFDPDWRWMVGRSDCPWYPTLRVFRQPDPGNWDAVVESVRTELSAFVSDRSPTASIPTLTLPAHPIGVIASAAKQSPAGDCTDPGGRLLRFARNDTLADERKRQDQDTSSQKTSPEASNPPPASPPDASSETTMPSSVTPAVQSLFAAAVQHHQAGRLDEAEQLFQQVLAIDPRHAGSLHLRGVVAYQTGHLDLAIDLISQAVAINPRDVQSQSNLGNLLQQQGRLDEAVACLRAAIELNPHFPAAHNNLGNALRGQGLPDEAIGSYRRAIDARPDYPEAHNNLGVALVEQGRLDEAIACYRKAIELRPNYPDAYNNLGNALREWSLLDEAVVAFRAALELKPDYQEAHNNLGIALQDQGRTDDAVACFRTAIDLAPDDPETRINLGLALQQQGRLDEAAACCDHALVLKPDFPEAYYNRGNVRWEQGRMDEAIASYRRAIELRPDYSGAHNNLGNALREQGLLEEAAASYRRAVELKPDYAEAYNNLSIVLLDMAQRTDAIACSRKALELRPDYPEAHDTLGNALRADEQLDAAIASYRRSIGCNPNYADAHSNLAMALLAHGNMAAGWEEYEWRWKTPQMSKTRRELAQPQWDGAQAEGQTLLIHAEQGFGDTLQFCRYAPLAAARGLRVILSVPRPLTRLLRSLPGVDQVVADGEPLPPFDLHCPMLSLPLVLGTATLADIPGDVPYLHADTTQVAAWRARLATMGRPGLRVGLVWAGNPRKHQLGATVVDRRRSIAPDLLAPLFDVPGLHFVSLQKDGPAAPENLPLTDVMGEMGDFADTAALVANLDLVISVDTAVVHLAGALGKPVWLLNRFDSCWRWLVGRSDSPWYPALRLFRQPVPGDWASVIENVREELGSFVQAHAPVTSSPDTVPLSAITDVQGLFGDGVRHHQAGRLTDAERIYRQVLDANPRHTDSLHLLGVIGGQTGRHDLAADMISRAIAVNPRESAYHCNLGIALMRQQRLDEAIACFRAALDLRPDYAEAHNNLGIALGEHGRPDEAIASYRRAIECLPNYVGALNNLGNALKAQGVLDEAIACFRRAIEVDPNSPAPYVNLGIALREHALLDEAVGCFQRAIGLNPNLVAAHNGLGIAFKEQGLLDEAVVCFRRALDLAPDFAEALNNLGTVLAEQARQDQAIDCYRRAIELNPNFWEAHNNLGTAFRAQGRLDEAVASYRQAIILFPDYADAHNNLAMTLLVRGDLAAGWPEYEWRWKTPQMSKTRREFAQPLWRGEPAEGQTLLIHAEQGLGDTLHFCRYSRLAAARGLRVILEVPRPLVRLLRSLPGVDQVVERGEALPDFDLHCPMLSMPLALETTLATVPDIIPYLHADTAQMAAWRERLGAMGGQGPRIGLVWAGNSRSHSPAAAAVDRRRSIAPERLAPLFEVPGLHFFSLQKDGPAAPEHFFNPQKDGPSAPEHVPLTDFMGEMADFADTAELIANLDLVISVDTSVAHLAGALGKPVWLLDRFDPDWRWLVGRGDSPWYPTLRIFRQPQPGDWDAVVENVRAELERFHPDWNNSPPAVIARSVATRQSPAGRTVGGLSGGGLLRRSAPRNDSGRDDSSQNGNALGVSNEIIAPVAAASRHPHESGDTSNMDRRVRLDDANVSGLFNDAVRHHQAGRLGEASSGYRRALDLKPDFPEAANNLGIVLQALGRLDEAIACFHSTLDLHPDDPEIHINLGLALQQQGRLDEAAAHCGTALDLRPEMPEAHYNLGNVLQQEGRLDEAITCYRRAIELRPDYQAAYHNLGGALRTQGRLDEAADCFRRIADRNPDDPESHFNCGSALWRQGNPGDAIACYRRALDLKPDYPEACNNLGDLLRSEGRFEEAVACLLRAIDLRPDYADAHNNLGIAQQDQGRLDEAAACFRRALELRPDMPAALNNLATALLGQGRLDEAVAMFRRALDVTPDAADAHSNLGVGLQSQGRLDEAVASFRRAVDLQPDYAEAHRNLGIALLARGDLAAGWEENEWRWKTANMSKARRDFAQPQWRGEHADGRTLLVHAEQGFGDTLQFCRYAPLAAAHGLRVILEVPGPLVRLLRSLPGVDRVVEHGEALPEFDLHCPMLSMPLAMGTTLATIPGEVPYLHADAAQVAAWRTRLAAMGRPSPRVGLVWAGNPRKHLPTAAAVDRRRSMSPERLAPLFELPGPHFFSLQQGGLGPLEHFPLTDFMHEMRDFADTAALIANLDLVISVDTAVAHLAAALGKPVWLLDRFDPDWRWLTGRSDSPWYPTLRIFRQPRPGYWDSVVENVRAELGAFGGDQALVTEQNTPPPLEGLGREADQGWGEGSVGDSLQPTPPPQPPPSRGGGGLGTPNPATLTAPPDMTPDLQALFSEAVRQHQAGRLTDAESLYRQVLAANPHHADSLHLLGVLGGQTGRHDLATDLIGQAIAINPQQPAYHTNLGAALKRQNRLDEAVACFRTALDLRPDDPEAHLNLGIALKELGRLEEAAACYRRAIELRPNFPRAHLNLGNALQEQGRPDEAAACYRQALDLDPGYADAQNNLANLLRAQRLADRGVGDRPPDDAGTHNNRGLALQREGRLDEAVASYRRAIDLDPNLADAHNNLGTALREQARPDEAAACYRRALELKPDYPHAHNNLANALRALGRLDEAVASYHRALELNPDYPEAYNNLGIARHEQGLLDEAVAAFHRSLELKPDNPDVHNNLGMSLLARGDLPEGWEECEWRWQTPQMANSRRHFTQPQWRGEHAEGRTLLIHAEQGFGDTLQFCRYAPLAAARGLRVILEVPRPLFRLVHSLPGLHLVVELGRELPEFDLHCPMLSLPLALGTTITNIPNAVPYLRPDTAEAAAWRTRLAALGNPGRRVGLVWAGNPRKDLPLGAALDRRRSIAPDRLAPLFELPGLHFFSLQKNSPAAPAHFPLTDFMDEMGDFADTAALIANLDLVISVDTAVAHLAGALGKPVWLLDRFDPDWRWLLGRRDSPWYPTLRIYRQPTLGDWDAVVESVRADLNTLGGGQNSPPPLEGLGGEADQGWGEGSRGFLPPDPSPQPPPLSGGGDLRTAVAPLNLTPDVRRMFADAVRHHQASRLADAEQLYRQVLAVDPGHADSLYLLGVTGGQTGRHDLAADMISRAIAINPKEAAYHFNLGVSLKRQGRPDEAVTAFRTALDLKPDDPNTLFNLANMLKEQGRLDEAIASYRRAIDIRPDYPEALNNLGNALREQGALEEAAACFRRAHDLKPDYAEALNNLGAVLRELGLPDEATACFREALDLSPNHPEAHNNLAIALQDQGRLDDAVAHFGIALGLKPDDPDTHTNLGVALQVQGRLDEAADSHGRALRLRPDFPEALYNLGNVFWEREDLDEAVACYRQALDRKPNYPQPYSNLANALWRQGLLGEAVTCYRRAIELNPSYADAHNHLGMALLARGDLAEGWQEYEWRWRTGQQIEARRDFVQPQWRGEPAEGRTLLIHAEQGLGDTLQFCRYAPLAAARGMRVILEVQPPLRRLLRSLAGVDQVVARGQALPGFDLHCPMLSLPLALGTNALAAIPGDVPYLHPDAAQVTAWEMRLAAVNKQGPRIGLVWAGNPRKNMPACEAIDRRRSIDPARLAPLFEVPGLHFVNLQKDGPAAPGDFPLTDCMDEVADFADTAALIANLDLVISVDTSVAHLAGALGKPVWLLDRFDPCWRWLTGRSDSPWYPTLRIFRQPRPGDWEAVIGRVRAELSAFHGGHAVATEKNTPPPIVGLSREADQGWGEGSTRVPSDPSPQPPPTKGGGEPSTPVGNPDAHAAPLGLKPDVQGLFTEAVQHHQAGDLAEAERLYREVLAANPRHADSLHLLGVIGGQTGRHDLAIDMIGRAIAIDPAQAAYHSNLGISLKQQERLNEAAACFRTALDLRPDDPEAHNNLGIALKDLSRLDEAAACYRRAIELRPNFARAHLNLGNALTDEGRLDEAIVSYRRAIDLKPDYPEAHNNLGNVLRDQGMVDEAVVCYRRALDLKPDYAETLNNLGNALRAQGRPDEVAVRRSAVDLRPDDPEAHLNLGVALRAQGRTDDAIACYRRAIELKPDDPAALNVLGNALRSQGRTEEAVACLRRAVALKPDYAEAHNNLGIALQAQGWRDEAVACYRRALDLRPDTPEILNNLGTALQDQARLEEAVACYRRAIDLDPGFGEAHNSLGAAFQEQGRTDEAAACYRRAIALKPDHSGAHNNLGTALQEQGLLDEAAMACRRAIDLSPDSGEAHNSLGTTLLAQGQLDEAIACYRSALELNPDYADAHCNLAMALLARGELAAGWEENEWRWKTPQLAKSYREFAQPQWRGEAAEGQTLLIHAEQGLGDNLQFCRYASLAAERGLKVIVEVPKPLARLLRSLPGVAQVVTDGDELPAFDLHCPMLSLPLALGTATMATIPSAVPYLYADPAQVAEWRERLAAMDNQGPRIGLVWAGNPREHLPSGSAVDRRRSIGPERLAPLFTVPGLHFFSLQKGGSPAPADFPLSDFMDEMGDFADTAALVANLDLVISVDTSVAHLAGALGKPVWLLDRFDSCWRWLVGRHDSPWYPTLRIFRQPRPGDWDSVVDSVRADLGMFVSDRPPATHSPDAVPASLTPDVPSVFDLAVQHHRAGRVTDAEALYRQVLAANPRHADSLHLLGVVGGQTGRHDLAIDMIGQAIAINPKAAAYHSNLAISLKQQGRLDEAATCFRTALDLQPDHAETLNNLSNARQAQERQAAVDASPRAIDARPDDPEAHFDLGVALRAQGRTDDAIACYRRAIGLQPDYPAAHINLGNTLRAQGRLDEAVACLRRAVDLRPDYADAYNNLGIALQGQGRLDEAADCYRRALDLRPDIPEAHNNLGTALQDLGRLDEAIACYRRALDLRPNFPDAHNGLGSALQEQGLSDEAAASYRRAIDHRPDFAAAYNNLGTALQEQGLLDEAAAACNRAITLNPDMAEAHNSLGTVMLAQGRLEEAGACLRRAIDLKPDYPGPHNNLAMVLLALGDMAAGWQEFEWRWQTPSMRQGRRDFAQPQWRGEHAEGRTLLIHAEQGLGDTVQFCRYATLAAERGLRVIVEAPPPLVRLLRSLSGVDQVVARGEALPHFDLHCPMLSMPLALGTTLATVPGVVPYLHAEAAQIAAWGERLAALGARRPRIGLVWAGNSHANWPTGARVNRRRSISPDRLAPLFAVPGLHFVNLQKDGAAARPNVPLIDFMAEMADFADTAALIANLDLVVSVDTAVAHLAGALGKPVWMLDRFDPCWRWLAGRRDSPWYPTLRIYRQPSPGDWDSVLAEVARDLAALAMDPMY